MRLSELSSSHLLYVPPATMRYAPLVRVIQVLLCIAVVVAGATLARLGGKDSN